MSESAGKVYLDVDVNQKSFASQLNGLAGTAMKVLGAAFAVDKMTSFTKSCLDLGSDLSEVQNVVDVTFGSMSSQVDAFAQTAITSLGMSETACKQYMGTYGAMSKAMGFSQQSAYNMAEAITKLTGDVSSFYNLSSKDAAIKLKSIWTGETESLKDLGVVMTQANLDAFAMANGFGKTTDEMSEGEKVALRYKFVLNALKDTQGDFARTSDSWANQTRILSEQFNAMKAAIGQGLINMLTPCIHVINTIMAKLVQLANLFKDFMGNLFGKKQDDSALASTTDDLSSMTAGADAASDAVDGVGDSAKDTAKKLKGLMGFDEINNLTSSKSKDDDKLTGAPEIEAMDFGGVLEKPKEEMSDFMTWLMSEFSRLKDLFVEGFKIGLGDYEDTIKSIKSELSSIKDSVVDIFTDSAVVNASKNFADSIALNLGKLTGSVASIGLTIADNLLGGISKYLDQNKNFIKDRLIGILDVGSEIANLAGNFAVAVADIFTVFRSDSAKQLTADIIAIFSNGFLGALELATKFARDILGCVVNPIIENKDKIKDALMNTIQPLETVLGAIAGLVTNSFQSFITAYDTYVAPAFQKIEQGLSSILGIILDTYNGCIAPVLQALADRFTNMVSGNLQPMIDSFATTFGKIASAVSTTWNETLVPFIDWVIANLGGAAAPILDILGTAFIDTFGLVCDVVKTALEVLGSFADWCTNNQGTVKAITVVVGSFMAAWKVTQLLAFIEKMGGIPYLIKGASGAMDLCTTALKTNTLAFFDNIGAMVADKAETIALTAMYAKDFVVSIAKSTAELAKSTGKLVLDTGAKYANAVAQGVMTAAATVWSGVCAVASVATTAFGAAVAFLTSPIGIAVVAVGLLVAAGIALYENWDTVKDFLINTWNTISSTATEVWSAVSTFFTETFNSISNTVNTVWGAIGDFLNNSWNTISSTATSVWTGISDFFSNTWNTISSTATTVWTTISTFFSTIWTGISTTASTIWGGIQGVFQGVLNFVSTTFAGGWSSAWEGIKSVFSNVFNSLIGIAKAPINAIIKLVNKLIDGLNSLKIDIPDWDVFGDLAGQSFGLDIPSIPMMAKGGIVDSPTLAMVGEAGKEAVMPLENNTGWISQLASQIAGQLSQGGNSNNGSSGDLYIMLDGSVIGKAALDEIEKRKKQGGAAYVYAR